MENLGIWRPDERVTDEEQGIEPVPAMLDNEPSAILTLSLPEVLDMLQIMYGNLSCDPKLLDLWSKSGN